MTRRLLVPVVIVAALAFGAPSPASAQSITVHLGGFAPRAEDARVEATSCSRTSTTCSSTSTTSRGSTWRRLPAGGHAQSRDRRRGRLLSATRCRAWIADFVNEDGSEIEQELKLRIVPVNDHGAVPSDGKPRGHPALCRRGDRLLAYRYSETGQFVDYDTYDIFRRKLQGQRNGGGAGRSSAACGCRWAASSPSAARSAIRGPTPTSAPTSGATSWISAGLTYSFTMTFRVLSRIVTP